MAAAGKEGLSFLQEFVQGFLFQQSKFLADTAASGVDAGTGDAQGQRDLVRALLQVDQHAEQFVGFGQFREVLTQAGQEARVQGSEGLAEPQLVLAAQQGGVELLAYAVDHLVMGGLLQLGAQSLIAAVQFLLGSEEIIQPLTLDLPLTLVKPATLECVDNDPGQQANG